MKYKYFLVVMAISLTALNAFAESEMDSEINDLQVRIIKIPKPKAKPVAKVKQATVTPKVYTYAARPVTKQAPVNANFYQAARVSRPVVVASATTTPVAAPETRTPVDYNGNTNTTPSVPESAPAMEQLQTETETTKAPRPSSSSTQFVRRVELLWGFTSGSFDGGDSSNLIPSGVSSQYNSSLTNGMLLTDISLGGSQFFIESGGMIAQMGSGTGVPASNGFTETLATSEKVTLTYFGVPLNLKWRMLEERDSSFFVKAGAIPAYMVSHAYLSSTNFNDENRFGAYNTFDILLDAGVGYDQKIWRDIHAVLDVSAFQGVLPVLANYSVFNYGLMVGLGAAYVF